MDRDEPRESEVDLDVAFDLLSSRRRRMVLAHLLLQDHESDVSTLAEQIAAWENDVPVAELDSDDRKRAYVTLYQTHLPKMAGYGVIEFDDANAQVSLTDRGASMLRLVADLDVPDLVAVDGIEIPDTVALD